MLQWPRAWGFGEEMFDLSVTCQCRRQCHRRAFHLPLPTALPWETGNLDACPQAKATKALKIRGFFLIDSQGIAALEAHPWELPPASWPCREGSWDGSGLLRVPRVGLEGQPFPQPGAGMQRVNWWDCVSPLQSSTKCSHPSKALRVWCPTTALAAGGSKTELFGNPALPPLWSALVGSGAQPVQAEDGSPKGWGRREGKRGRSGRSRAWGQVPVRLV